MGSPTGIFTSPVPDPGYGQEVSLFIGDLEEISINKFTVRAENFYDGLSTSYSQTEIFETKGEYSICKCNFNSLFFRQIR